MGLGIVLFFDLTPKGLDLFLQGLLNMLQTTNTIVISLTPVVKTEHPHEWSRATCLSPQMIGATPKNWAHQIKMHMLMTGQLTVGSLILKRLHSSQVIHEKLPEILQS